MLYSANTPCYGIGKYLSTLRNPLTHNKYSVKDTFDTLNKVPSIPPELFEQRYGYYSLDVLSKSFLREYTRKNC